MMSRKIEIPYIDRITPYTAEPDKLPTDDIPVKRHIIDLKRGEQLIHDLTEKINDWCTKNYTKLDFVLLGPGEFLEIMTYCDQNYGGRYAHSGTAETSGTTRKTTMKLLGLNAILSDQDGMHLGFEDSSNNRSLACYMIEHKCNELLKKMNPKFRNTIG